jgi:hypothetical protein
MYWLIAIIWLGGIVYRFVNDDEVKTALAKAVKAQRQARAALDLAQDAYQLAKADVDQALVNAVARAEQAAATAEAAIQPPPVI